MAKIREEVTFLFPVCECGKDMEYANYEIERRIHIFRCPSCKTEKCTDNIRNRFMYNKAKQSA